jgi:hypothetical protein
MTKISTKFFLAWLFISPFVMVIAGLAQSPTQSLTLTQKDKDNITAKARRMLTYPPKEETFGLNFLLNFIASDGWEKDELDSLISQSYSQGTSKIFDNGKIIIEDDIDPIHTSTGQTEDLTLDAYLTNLNLYYSKWGSSGKPSIIFSNIRPMPVQQDGNSIYIKVYFNSTFKGQYNSKNNSNPPPYNTTERVIEMRAEKPGKYWQVYITRIGFQKPGEGAQLLANTKTPSGSNSLNSANPIGKPTIPPSLSISGTEVAYRQVESGQVVNLKWNSLWLEVTKSEVPDLPLGFFQRQGPLYIYDNTRSIEFKKNSNSNKLVFHKDVSNVEFDRMKPILQQVPKRDSIAKPVIPIIAHKPISRPDTTTIIANRTPQKESATTVANPSVTSSKPQVKADTIKASNLAVNASKANTKPEQEIGKPAATITVVPAKSVASTDSAQHITNQIPTLNSSNPTKLPSTISGLVSVSRNDSIKLASIPVAKPDAKKEESIVKVPEPQKAGPAVSEAIDAETKKIKARYRMQGWLQVAAGIAGLTGSYLGYSAIKKDYDAYMLQMNRLNTEYNNWLAVSRQQTGATLTPMSITSYGKPATYGIYAGGGISLGLVVNGVRTLMKIGKVKSRVNPSTPNIPTNPPSTIISTKK